MGFTGEGPNRINRCRFDEELAINREKNTGWQSNRNRVLSGPSFIPI